MAAKYPKYLHLRQLLVLAFRQVHEGCDLVMGALEVVDGEGVHTDVLHTQV